jgi:hypothetical protein
MVRVSGLSPPVQLHGYVNDINTLERAVNERVFYVKNGDTYQEPPRPAAGVFWDRVSGSMNALRKFLPSTAPLTRLEFVETFRGRKRKLYEDAYSSLMRESVKDKDAELRVFVKYEKTNFTQKTDPVPRVISPRSPRYNIEVGRYLRRVEEKIFRSIGRLYGHPTVMKGFNSQTTGRLLREKWDKFVDPVAVGVDASRFDQHVSVDALVSEHRVYGWCFKGRRCRSLRRLLAKQLKNVCKGYAVDGKLEYRSEGGRMSGDMNTSLGNCILMCIMLHAYAKLRRVSVHLANNGDDCVIFLEKRDLARFMSGFKEWFHEMGFNMVVEDPVDCFEKLEFCQTHPVFVGSMPTDYLMVRHPFWGIAKDTCCVHAWQSSRMFKGWLHAVGTGGLAATGGVPIFQDFYTTLIRDGAYVKSASDSQSWGVRQLSKGMARVYQPVKAVTRASFYYAFGITPDEQLVIEEFYRGVAIDSKLQSVVTWQPRMPGWMGGDQI